MNYNVPPLLAIRAFARFPLVLAACVFGALAHTQAQVHIPSTTAGYELTTGAGASYEIDAGTYVTRSSGGDPAIYDDGSATAWYIVNNGTIGSPTNNTYPRVGIYLTTSIESTVINNGYITFGNAFTTTRAALRSVNAYVNFENNGIIDAPSMGMRLQKGGNITNSGLIVTASANALRVGEDGNYWWGIFFEGGEKYNTLNNSGTIQGSTVIEMRTSGSIYNSGLIQGYEMGIWAERDGARTYRSTAEVTVVNDGGSILATYASTNGTNATAIRIGSYSPYAHIENINSGTIQGGAIGTGIYIGGTTGDNTIINNASFIGGGTGVYMESGTLINTNGGVISGASRGVTINGSASITNTGTILATNADGASIYFAATSAAAQSSLTLGTDAALQGDVISAKASGNSIILEGSGYIGVNFLGTSVANGFDSFSMNGAAWTLSGTIALTGAAADALSINNGALTLTGNAKIVMPDGAGVGLKGGALALDLVNGSAFDTDISGSGNLIHAGAALLELTGANTYVGETTITSGTLKGNVGSSVLNLAAAMSTYIVDPAATEVTLGGIKGIGIVDIQNANLHFDVQGASTTETYSFAGTLDSNGGNKLIKTGDGKFVLTQSLASALNGGTEVRDGVLSLSDASHIVTTGLVLGGGTTAGMIEYTGAGDWSINVTLAGAGGGFYVGSGSKNLAINVGGEGAFVKGGDGALDIRNAIFGDDVNVTDVRGGTLIANKDTLCGNITFSNNSTLIYDYSGASIFSDTRAISGDGNLIKTGDGLLEMTGSTTYTGDTTIRSGTLQGNIGTGSLIVEIDATYKVADGVTEFSLAGITGGGNVDLNAASLFLDVAANVTSTFAFSGNLLSSNPLSKFVKTGAGTTDLQSAVTLQGGTEIRDGALRLANQEFITTPIVLGTGTTAGLIEYTGDMPWAHDVTLADGGGGGFLVASGTQTLTNAFVISGGGDFVKAGAGVLDILSANFTDLAQGGVRVVDGALLANTTTLKTGGIAMEAAGSMVEFKQATDGVYAGDITGPGALIKTGAGSLELTGNNSYGNTDIRDGLLAGNIGDGLLTVAASGTYRVAVGTTDFVTTGIQGAGTIDLLNANMRFDVQSGTSAYAFSGSLIGGNQLLKTGSGTLDLHSPVALGDGALIEEGVTRLADQSFLRSPIVMGSGSTEGFVEYTGAAPWTHAVTLQGQGGGFVVNSGSAVISGALIANGGAPLIKTGEGTLDITPATLTGINDVRVRGGILRGDAQGLGAASADISAGAAFELWQDADSVFNGSISGAGDFLKSGAGALTLAGTLGHTGVTRINQGRIIISGSGVLSSTARMSIAAAGALDIGWLTQTIGSLDNDGTVYVDASVNSRAGVILEAGRLIVSGTAGGTGKILVRLTEDDRYSIIYPGAMVVAEFSGSTSSYTLGLAERTVEGPYEWAVILSADGLRATLTRDMLSPEVPATAGLDAGAYYSGKAALDSLNLRLAALRAIQDSGKTFQVWASWLRYDDTLNEDLYKDTPIKTDGIQVGAEWNLTDLRGAARRARAARTFDYRLVAGIHYDSTQAVVKIPGGFSQSTTDSHGLGVYGSYRASSLYVDVILRNARNKFNGDVYYGEKSRFRTEGYAMSGAVEVGGQIQGKSSWKLEPMVRMTYQTYKIDPFVDGMGRQIEVDTDDSLEGRAGLRLSREFASEDRSRLFVPYLRGSLAYETKAGARITFADTDASAVFNNKRSGYVTMIEGGFAYAVGFGFRIQLDGAWYQGETVEGKSIHVGTAFSW